MRNFACIISFLLCWFTQVYSQSAIEYIDSTAFYLNIGESAKALKTIEKIDSLTLQSLTPYEKVRYHYYFAETLDKFSAYKAPPRFDVEIVPDFAYPDIINQLNAARRVVEIEGWLGKTEIYFEMMYYWALLEERRGNIDLAISVIQETLVKWHGMIKRVHHENTGIARGVGFLINKLAKYYQSRGWDNMVVELYEMADEIFNIDYNAEISYVPNQMLAYFYNSRNKFDKAIECFDKSLNLLESHSDTLSREYNRLLESKAVAMDMSGEHTQAILLYEHALDRIEKANYSDDYQVNSLLNNLYIAHCRRGSVAESNIQTRISNFYTHKMKNGVYYDCMCNLITTEFALKNYNTVIPLAKQFLDEDYNKYAGDNFFKFYDDKNDVIKLLEDYAIKQHDPNIYNNIKIYKEKLSVFLNTRNK